MQMIPKEGRLSYDKVCGVCGDYARCVNYGGISCESCKTFFRRAHINHVYRQYQCMKDSNCFIDAVSRKDCQACRYRRCIWNGMDAKHLKSEKEKTADLAKKRSKYSLVSTQNSRPLAVLNQLGDPKAVKLSLDDKSKFFTMMEMLDMDTLISKYAVAFYDIPYTEETISLRNDVLKAAAVVIETLQRLFFFCFLVPQFRELDLRDQVILLSKGASDLSLLNAVLGYDSNLKSWPRPDCRFYRTTVVKLRNFAGVLGVDQCEKDARYLTSMQQLRPDEPVLMLLFFLVLFHPGRENLKDPVRVAKHQMYFARLFKNYLNWRYGAAQGSKLFQQFIAKVTELRTSDSLVHGMAKLCETHPEVSRMKCCRTYFTLVFARDGLSLNNIVH